MSFSGATIKYKPLRIGFLVRDGLIEDLVKAAGINSLLWGGIYNPIIPVSATGDNAFAKQLINLFSVDILYAVVQTPQILSLQNEYPFFRDPGHYAERIFYEDWHTKKQILGFLDAKNIVDLFWMNEYKNKPSGYKSNFALVSWSAEDLLANVLALQFGFFPIEPDLKWNYKKIFLNGLHAQEVNISQGDNLTMNPRKTFGPINTTSVELRGYATGVRWNGHGIYIGDPDNFHDLLSFWNIRASDISVVYLAKDHLVRNLPFAQAHIDFLNSLPNRHPNIEDRLSIYYRFEDEELLKIIAGKIVSKKNIGWHKVSEYSWNGLNIQPVYQVFKWQSTTTHIDKSHNKYVVNVRLPQMNFLVDEDDTEVNHQQLGVIIEPYGSDEYDHPGYTLKVPRIIKLNEFYSQELAFNPWSFRIEHEGFSKIIKPNTESISLYPISIQALIEKLFEISGITAKTSQPGLIAKKIIEKIGDLEDARVLKIKGVRIILEKGGTEHAITRGGATNIINNNDFIKHKRLFIEARDKSNLDSNDVFNYLLKKEYFRAGLELTCEHCKLENWLTLKAIDDQWLCEYCGGTNQTSGHLNNKGDWKFRKSGLFSKGNHQEGAIPVLLTLLTLKRIANHSNFNYTTALKLNGEGINCETDLFVMQEKYSNDFEMGIGECKSDGGVITKDDCDKLKAVAKKLACLKEDAKVYIIFSKTADAFLAEEIKLFKELSKEVNLVLFTNKELELYHPYWLDNGEIEKDIPERYPHSLAELSRNSYTRYLEEKKSSQKTNEPKLSTQFPSSQSG